jgi:uncharacterized protein YlxW (UPF0749 family)
MIWNNHKIENENQAKLALLTSEFNDLSQKVSRLNSDREDLWRIVKEISEQKSKPTDLTDIEKRLVVLDAWRAQLHSLLTEKGNTGKDKLSRMGNRLATFYNR